MPLVPSASLQVDTYTTTLIPTNHCPGLSFIYTYLQERGKLEPDSAPKHPQPNRAADLIFGLEGRHHWLGSASLSPNTYNEVGAAATRGENGAMETRAVRDTAAIGNSSLLLGGTLEVREPPRTPVRICASRASNCGGEGQCTLWWRRSV